MSTTENSNVPTKDISAYRITIEDDRVNIQLGEVIDGGKNDVRPVIAMSFSPNGAVELAAKLISACLEYQKRTGIDLGLNAE